MQFCPTKYFAHMTKRILQESWINAVCLHTWCLGGGALQEAEEVSAGLADGSHLGNDGQVVDDEGHLIALLLRQVAGVAKNAEACDVGGCVRVELVH